MFILFIQQRRDVLRLKNLLSKLTKRFIGLIFIVIGLNLIKVGYSSVFINEINNINKVSSKTVNASNITETIDSTKNLLSEASKELAKGKVIIRIISVDAKDSILTIKVEVENNSQYLVSKSPYNFHLVDSTKKKMELKTIDNNSLGSDIVPNSRQVFPLVFTNVNLSAKPMKLKGELFIPDPRVKDDKFSLDINY